MASTSKPKSQPSALPWVWAAIALLYYLNDLANFFVKDWRLWLLIDYGVLKFGTLLGVASMLHCRWFTSQDIGFIKQSPVAFIAVFLGLTTLSVLACLHFGPYLMKLVGNKQLAGMPAIVSPFWNRFDLTMGLFFVGLTEELVFRGLLYRVLSRWTTDPATMIYVSAVLFGLIHWSAGLHAIINTALIGAVFMAVYVRTRALPALILAHFAVDYILFNPPALKLWLSFYS